MTETRAIRIDDEDHSRLREILLANGLKKKRKWFGTFYIGPGITVTHNDFYESGRYAGTDVTISSSDSERLDYLFKILELYSSSPNLWLVE